MNENYETTLNRMAMNIHTSPGTYALLIGSGLSSSAKIKTGWGILEDLVRKLAKMNEDEIAGDNWEHWYMEKYKEDPHYSKIIKFLGGTGAERRNLLNDYFEPTPEELESGEKIPQAAHKAIAGLVTKGYIKVIITTNFDKLLEHAVEAKGITPNVITESRDYHIQPDSKCTIIKVNGDYKDNNIKNTEDELSKYPKKMKDLLNFIFDNYGLIICGWSGDYDKGLRKIILKTPNKRYSQYWTHRSDVSEMAQDLIDSRDMTQIKIENADTFFSKLEDKIEAIESYNYQPPENIKLYEEELKSLYKKDIVKFEDTIIKELRKYNDSLPNKYTFNSPTEANNEIPQIEYNAMKMLIIVKTLSRLDLDNNFINLLIHTRQLLSRYNLVANNCEVNLLLYPNLLFHYVIGITSLKYDNPEYLKVIFKDNYNTKGDNAQFPIYKFYPKNIFVRTDYSGFPKSNSRVYDFLLKNIFSNSFIGEDEYKKYFNLFELLLCLTIELILSNAQPPFGLFHNNSAYFNFYHAMQRDYDWSNEYIEKNLLNPNSNHFIKTQVFNEYEDEKLIKTYKNYKNQLRQYKGN